jgi:hypothetical protein
MIQFQTQRAQVKRCKTQGKTHMRSLITVIALFAVVSCASPIQQMAKTRQAEIVHMPNGRVKQQAQANLDESVMLQKQVQKRSGRDAGITLASALFFGIPGILVSSIATAAAESDSDLTNKYKAATEEAKAYNQQHQVSR